MRSFVIELLNLRLYALTTSDGKKKASHRIKNGVARILASALDNITTSDFSEAKHTTIKSESCPKYLGVQLDRSFTFKTCVSNPINKVLDRVSAEILARTRWKASVKRDQNRRSGYGISPSRISLADMESKCTRSLTKFSVK